MKDDSAPLLLMVPQRKLNWTSFGISFAVQFLLVIMPVKFGVIQPQSLAPAKIYHLTALVSTPTPQRPAPRTPRNLLPRVEPQVVAKLAMPVPEQIKAPELATRQVVPHPEMPRRQLADLLPPARLSAPLKIVRTGAFESTGSQAVATVKLAAQQVQTGGFGDPNGIKGEGKPGTRANIASVGSFDLPSGPGFGNGTGGTRGARGTVASVGFGNGVAIGNSDRNSSGNGRSAIQQSGFGDSRSPVEARPARVVPVVAKTTPVQVLSKPNPVYTEEARQMKIEGEVLLEVAFSAAGECRVVRVLRGLGHGLDEAATRAASQIRFRPATRNGEPVDSTASIHVVFQLAY